MRSLKTRLLVAAVLVFATLFTPATTTVAEPLSPSPAATTTAAPAPDPCPARYSRAQYRKYAAGVFKRKRISSSAKKRLSAMRRCAHSSKAHRYMHRLDKRLMAERRERARIARMGVKGIAYMELTKRGMKSHFGCLVALWNRESGWRVTAHNPSGAHGIPQALPGSKMGPGWYSNAHVQIRWGVRYIVGRYGTPCNANSRQLSQGWY